MPRARSRRSGDSVGLVPTGSTLLNLACSNTVAGAFKLGTLNNIIGDSSAGKSLLCLNMLAEIAQRSEFKDHLFIYDDVERRLFFDIRRLFGSKVADRIVGPDGPVTESASSTIESFYYNVDNRLREGRPFFWFLDSMDGLDSEASERKFQENKEAFQKEKEGKGSYGDGKAKINSENMRKITQNLRNTNSALIIISQTRDNLNPGFQPKTRAGGRALEFYASHIMWLAKVKKIKKMIRGKNRTIGVDVRASISKNSLTGLQTEVDFPLYYGYGLDDISSMIDFLIDEKELQVSANSIIWNDQKFSRAKLVKYFEENGTRELQILCKKVWTDITDQLFPDRKPRYE